MPCVATAAEHGAPAASAAPRAGVSRTARAARVLHRARAHRVLDAAWGGDRLTVLLYHRIGDAWARELDHDPATFSATTEDFERQMRFVAREFNVVSLGDVVADVSGCARLPARPALVTFDDGYHDNYTEAFPVLRGLSLPAVIFLITGAMGGSERPWWDVSAHAFRRTARDRAVIPMLGERDLASAPARRRARSEFSAQVKRLPRAGIPQALERLRDALEVSAPPVGEPRLFVTWDEVRLLVAGGVACQPHTRTHPILSRVSAEEARSEIADAIADVSRETGQAALAFAYPNGGAGDYGAPALGALRAAGIPLAFTTALGPVRIADVRRRPLEVARICVSHRNTWPMFVLKTMGGARFGKVALP